MSLCSTMPGVDLVTGDWNPLEVSLAVSWALRKMQRLGPSDSLVKSKTQLIHTCSARGGSSVLSSSKGWLELEASTL